MASRFCKARNARGDPCGGTPRRETDYCVFHDPDQADVVAQARSAGGQRRKREATIAIAYDFEGLTSVEKIRRLIDIAVVDVLSLDNSLGRVRTLGYLAQVATTLLEKGEQEEATRSVERVLAPRMGSTRQNRRR
jgi:hypothetical protein